MTITLNCKTLPDIYLSSHLRANHKDNKPARLLENIYLIFLNKDYFETLVLNNSYFLNLQSFI